MLIPYVTDCPEGIRGIEPAARLVYPEGVKGSYVGEFIWWVRIPPNNASTVTLYPNYTTMFPVGYPIGIGKF